MSNIFWHFFTKTTEWWTTAFQNQKEFLWKSDKDWTTLDWQRHLHSTQIKHLRKQVISCMLRTLIVWLVQADCHKLLDPCRFLCRIGVCEEGPNLDQTLLNAQNPVKIDRGNKLLFVTCRHNNVLLFKQHNECLHCKYTGVPSQCLKTFPWWTI